MKSYCHIKGIQEKLEKVALKLPSRESDQAYGASEALRWVLGKGPNIRHFLKSFREVMNET